MEVYLGLIILLFLGTIITSNKKIETKNSIITYTVCCALFLLYILRDFVVGIDMQGYERTYKDFDSLDLTVLTSTYLERGYVFLMQLFNYLGLTFRGFICVIYITFLIPFAIYLIKYSKDVTLSLLIFICFQFLVFTMSGIRQTAATGLCIAAFLVAQKKGIKALIQYLILIIAACNIHQSSIVFLPAYAVMRMKLNKKMIGFYLLSAAIGVIIRKPLNAYMISTELTPYGIQDNLTIGTTFYLMLIATLYVVFQRNNPKYNENENLRFVNHKEQTQFIEFSLMTCANLMVCCLIILATFSGTIMMRASLYYEIVLLIMIPNMIKKMDQNFQPVIRTVVFLLLIAIFYFTVLIPQQFEIVPYVFAEKLQFFK